MLQIGLRSTRCVLTCLHVLCICFCSVRHALTSFVFAPSSVTCSMVLCVPFSIHTCTLHPHLCVCCSSGRGLVEARRRHRLQFERRQWCVLLPAKQQSRRGSDHLGPTRFWKRNHVPRNGGNPGRGATLQSDAVEHGDGYEILFSSFVLWYMCTCPYLHMSCTHVMYTCHVHMSCTHVIYTCHVHTFFRSDRSIFLASRVVHWT